MGKDKTREYFYSGVVSVETREPTIHFCGTWTAEKDDTFDMIIESILDFESYNNSGQAVLTNFNELKN